MLSELMFAGTKVEKKTNREPGISGSSLYPCPYRLYQVHIGTEFYDEPTPQRILNMEDGWDQEEQTVRRLWEKCKVKIEDRQSQVYLGKSKVPGHIDGTITLNGTKRLWEHKAWSSDAFDDFTRWGLKYRPQEYSQINGYMVGMSLEETDFMVKKKETNDYYDIIFPLDLDFINPIITWCDMIRLDGWKPEPKECKWCRFCGLHCFDAPIDFSWMEIADAEDIVAKWKKGKAFKEGGELLMEEARAYLVGVKDKSGFWLKKGIIGDKELLRVGDLEIRKITSRRFDIDKGKILDFYGPDGLSKVGSENIIESYRIREV